MLLTSMLQRTRGISDVHVTPEQAAQFPYTEQESAFVASRLANHLRRRGAGFGRAVGSVGEGYGHR